MRAISLALALIALSFAGTALAQTTGSRIKPAPAQIPEKFDSQTARIGMAAYAECLAQSSRPHVERFLATFPGSPEAQKAAARLSDSDCLSSGALKFKEPVLRARLYEYLYVRDFEKLPVGDIGNAPTVDYARGEAADGSVEVALREFADCVARGNADAARQLVLSSPATSAEQQSFAALMPSFSACLPKDQTLSFSKSILKGLVAETLYRITSAVASRPTSGGAS